MNKQLMVDIKVTYSNEAFNQLKSAISAAVLALKLQEDPDNRFSGCNDEFVSFRVQLDQFLFDITNTAYFHYEEE